MEQQQAFNWEVPQRQPLAGLGVVFIKTLFEILKRVWPFLLLALFREKKEDEGVGKYELIAAAFAAFTIVGSIIKFYFFRFFILGEELVIKKGWIKKETIVIPLQKIQTVHIEQTAVHQVLNIVKLSVDTAGSSKTEVTIDALSRPMAEALQAKLQSAPTTADGKEEQTIGTPILTLGINDLLKLSFSANHMEAFFILLSFVYGLYDSIKTISPGFVDEATGFFPGRSMLLLAILAAAVLVITILISTIRIFLKFYSFSVVRNPTGFYIRRGLTNVKEQLVPFGRIQFITWSANWIRKKMGLWLLEYKVAGGTDVKNKMKVEVPVTRSEYIDSLVAEYHPLPNEHSEEAVRIHPSYVVRKILMVGIVPALLLIAITWNWWGANALLLCFIPVLVGINAALLQKKFHAFAGAEVLYIDRSTYGTKMMLLKWHKLQTVTIEQSIYQRRKELATLRLHTAGGTIVLPFIALPAANAFMNYALYKIESGDEPWM
jgi:putative membrane protein